LLIYQLSQGGKVNSFYNKGCICQENGFKRELSSWAQEERPPKVVRRIIPEQQELSSNHQGLLDDLRARGTVVDRGFVIDGIVPILIEIKISRDKAKLIYGTLIRRGWIDDPTEDELEAHRKIAGKPSMNTKPKVILNPVTDRQENS